MTQRHMASGLAVFAVLAALAPASLAAQAGAFPDSLLDQARALARGRAGERPRAIHESSSSPSPRAH